MAITLVESGEGTTEHKAIIATKEAVAFVAH